MEKIKVGLIQSSIIWENKNASLTNYERLIKGGADLYVFPEMFTTGFSMNTSELAEDMDGPSISWLQDKAKELDAAMCASLIIRDEGIRNRFVFVQPNGKIEYYDKRHLFSMAKENEHFKAGKERKIITYKGWRFMLQVCYDLRFPVFSRNQFQKNAWEYDALIYVANWPSPRSHVWRTLIEARAHENQSYVIAVNRVGKDGNGLEYLGDSAVIDPKGYSVLSFEKGEERCASVELSPSEIKGFRKKFPLGRDADDFILLG